MNTTLNTRHWGHWLQGMLMASLLVLGGCASTGSSFLSQGPAPDPRLTAGNDAQFFSKSGFQACVGAATVGVLACMVSNASDKASCAVVAAIATCGVAMGANYYLDYRRSQYANTGERLKAMSDDVQADTKKVVERTNTVMQVIQDDKATLAKIERDMKTQQVDQSQAKQQLAQVDKNIEVMSHDVDNMKSMVQQYQDVAQSEKQNGNTRQVKLIEGEITKMNKKVTTLEAEVDALYEQRSAISLG